VDDRAADLLGRSLANGGPTPRLLLGRCYLETNPARAAAEFPWTDHLLDEAKRSPAGVEAAVRMAKSLPERPVSAFSLLLFGEYLLLGGEPTKSAECLAAAVAQESHPVHHKSLGWALLACGRREEGRAQLRKALAGDWSSGPPPGADVNDWTAAYLLGRVTAEQYTARWRDGPKATLPWFYIGQRQEMDGDAPGAISSYRNSVAYGQRPGAEDTWTFAAYRLKVLTNAPDRP
jgi:hypothetical protein